MAALAGVVLFAPVWAKLLSGLAAGVAISRLFIIGHDACHHSLTPHRTLNKWLGRIAFLPSLTPYSLWDVGHNVVHHGYTNLKGLDFVWAPSTREESEALSAPRRLMDRIYRSGWAPGLYYMVEIRWKRSVPSRQPPHADSPAHLHAGQSAGVDLRGGLGGGVVGSGRHSNPPAYCYSPASGCRSASGSRPSAS